ncbi:hypothetical protein V2J09_002004 [Rumex salicifolius]
MIIPIIILYLLNLLTTLDLDLNILSVITIFNYFWNLGENSVQPSTPRKKKTRKPGRKISDYFAKQKHLLTLNGSTCSEIRGYTIDRLYVSDKEIGKGSNGTVVFEGLYQGREVAVKRLSKPLENEALKQVQHLIKSDHHQNIVRFHGVKRDNEYVYLALERCFCSLSDLVSLSANSQEPGNQTPLKATKQDINLDMVHGLDHLRELGIIHEITPENVMIAKGIDCAKLSEIGVSKHLISGKKATGSSRRFPAKQKHQRRSADMFSLGHVFYFCLSRGGCPSANQLQDDINIGNKHKLVSHIPEAVDLLSHLQHPDPKRRPNAKQVLQHPLFWDSERRLSFLRDVSDRLQRERKKCSSKFLVALEGVGIRVFGARWDKKMDPEVVKAINCCRRDQKKSAKNLLRAVRNLLNHYHENPKEIQELLGSLPEGLDSYFSCRFPRLLMEVYKVVFCYCRSEKTFERKKKTSDPGKNIYTWFDKQKSSLTLNGSTCSEIHCYTIDRLYVSTEEIARGSNGTVVFKGVYDGREVAVKRLLHTSETVALREVRILSVSDYHPNIVRLHGVRCDKEYVYLVLERCICSLNHLVLQFANSLRNSDESDQMLWKSNGYPSTFLLKLMRDMVHGLVHLHELGIVHGDISPQNVMIAKGMHSMDFCAKLSEIGIGKPPTYFLQFCVLKSVGPRLVDWRADSGSSRKNKHKGQAADMFSLGFVFYFCLSLSGYSSDQHLEDDDINIGNNRMSLKLVNHIPEALDLLSQLQDPNTKVRPTARQVLHHPMFWDSEMRLSFLRDVSDRLTLKGKKYSSEEFPVAFPGALESVGQRVFGASWDKKMESELIDDMNRGRDADYKYNSVRHLLRFVRNKMNHYHESSMKIKELIGSLPEGVDDYFICRFPRLLIEVYKVVIHHCRSEKIFERYFGVDAVPIV